LRDTLHPGVEWYPFEDNHTPSQGVEGAMRIRNGWRDAREERQIAIEQGVDSDDCVIVSIHVTGWGKSSEHTDRVAALEAAGLSAVDM
jgi:hypothetical protein